VDGDIIHLQPLVESAGNGVSLVAARL